MTIRHCLLHVKVLFWNSETNPHVIYGCLRSARIRRPPPVEKLVTQSPSCKHFPGDHVLWIMYHVLEIIYHIYIYRIISKQQNEPLHNEIPESVACQNLIFWTLWHGSPSPSSTSQRDFYHDSFVTAFRHSRRFFLLDWPGHLVQLFGGKGSKGKNRRNSRNHEAIWKNERQDRLLKNSKKIRSITFYEFNRKKSEFYAYTIVHTHTYEYNIYIYIYIYTCVYKYIYMHIKVIEPFT